MASPSGGLSLAKKQRLGLLHRRSGGGSGTDPAEAGASPAPPPLSSGEKETRVDPGNSGAKECTPTDRAGTPGTPTTKTPADSAGSGRRVPGPPFTPGVRSPGAPASQGDTPRAGHGGALQRPGRSPGWEDRAQGGSKRPRDGASSQGWWQRVAQQRAQADAMGASWMYRTVRGDSPAEGANAADEAAEFSEDLESMRALVRGLLGQGAGGERDGLEDGAEKETNWAMERARERAAEQLEGTIRTRLRGRVILLDNPSTGKASKGRGRGFRRGRGAHQQGKRQWVEVRRELKEWGSAAERRLREREQAQRAQDKRQTGDTHPDSVPDTTRLRDASTASPSTPTPHSGAAATSATIADVVAAPGDPRSPVTTLGARVLCQRQEGNQTASPPPSNQVQGLEGSPSPHTESTCVVPSTSASGHPQRLVTPCGDPISGAVDPAVQQQGGDPGALAPILAEAAAGPGLPEDAAGATVTRPERVDMGSTDIDADMLRRPSQAEAKGTGATACRAAQEQGAVQQDEHLGDEGTPGIGRREGGDRKEGPAGRAAAERPLAAHAEGGRRDLARALDKDGEADSALPRSVQDLVLSAKMLHELWQGYYSSLLRSFLSTPASHGSPFPSTMSGPKRAALAERVLASDLLGAHVTVIMSKDPSLVGVSGVVVRRGGSALFILSSHATPCLTVVSLRGTTLQLGCSLPVPRSRGARSPLPSGGQSMQGQGKLGTCQAVLGAEILGDGLISKKCN